MMLMKYVFEGKMTDYVIKYNRPFRILHNDVPRFSTMNVKKRKKETSERMDDIIENIYHTIYTIWLGKKTCINK